MLKQQSLKKAMLVLFVLVFAATFASGCNASAADPTTTDEHAMEHDMESTMAPDMEHEHSDERVPNNGAVIRVVSPEDGASFAHGEDIVVEVEIENFELNVDGSHWHVYVDGVSFGMVVGDTTTQVLRNLEPGEHLIQAYLAGGDHIELEDPGMVTITVNE